MSQIRVDQKFKVSFVKIHFWTKIGLLIQCENVDQYKFHFKIFYFSKLRCLKITEKVSFNIASEASYVYILSGQKLIKNAKIGPFWRVFENLKLAVKQFYQTGQF